MGFRRDNLTILGWMVTDLHLSGRELMAYAMIYGFSQDGVSAFCDDYEYAAKWLSCRAATAKKVIEGLVESGLVTKGKCRLMDGMHDCYQTVVR